MPGLRRSSRRTALKHQGDGRNVDEEIIKSPSKLRLMVEGVRRKKKALLQHFRYQPKEHKQQELVIQAEEQERQEKVQDGDSSQGVPKIAILPTGLSGSKKMKVKSAAERLGLTVFEKFTPEVIHIICEAEAEAETILTPKCLTGNILLGVSAGIKIMSMEWLVQSDSIGYLLQEGPFEIKAAGGDFLSRNSFEKARYSNEKLFKGFELCFLAAKNKKQEVEKDILEKVVIHQGGIVHHEAQHLCRTDTVKPLLVLIEDEDEESEHEIPVIKKYYTEYGIPTCSKSWVVDSLMEFSLAPLGFYTIIETRWISELQRRTASADKISPRRSSFLPDVPVNQVSMTCASDSEMSHSSSPHEASMVNKTGSQLHSRTVIIDSPKMFSSSDGEAALSREDASKKKDLGEGELDSGPSPPKSARLQGKLEPDRVPQGNIKPGSSGIHVLPASADKIPPRRSSFLPDVPVNQVSMTCASDSEMSHSLSPHEASMVNKTGSQLHSRTVSIDSPKMFSSSDGEAALSREDASKKKDLGEGELDSRPSPPKSARLQGKLEPDRVPQENIKPGSSGIHVLPEFQLDQSDVIEDHDEVPKYPEGSAEVTDDMMEQAGEKRSAHVEALSDEVSDSRRELFKNITVETYKQIGDRRNYRTTNYCMFCRSTLNSKISTHFTYIHSTENQVKKILELPLNSKERKQGWLLLQHESNYEHNVKVIEVGEGKLIVVRRPTENSKDICLAENYLPCEFCYGFIRKDCLWKHFGKCPAAPKQKQPEANYVRNGMILVYPFLRDRQNEMKEDLLINETLDGMKETTCNPGLKAIAREDPLIREFTISLLDKLGLKEEQRRKDLDNVRKKVRSVARLLVKLNESKLNNQPLSSFLLGPKFMEVVSSVKELSLEADSPHLAVTLGHYIKQVCLLKISLGIMEGDERKKNEAKDFEELYKAYWNSKVAAVANRRIRLRALNKPNVTPVTSDLVKLKDFLITEIRNDMQVCKPSFQEWTKFAQNLLVRILLFNKRRVGEVEELKVTDYTNKPNEYENQEIVQSMDITERALAERMEVIEVRGKSTRGLRKVFVLLTRDMCEAIQYLLKTRKSAHISCQNKYVFGTTGKSPIDGCKAVRDVTQRCSNLAKPEAIRSRHLRKYLATATQILDMNKVELKLLADHMGHNLDIHTDVYRLQSCTLERTKVARILMAVENGGLRKFKGLSLDNIQTEDLPLPISYGDKWDSDQHDDANTENPGSAFEEPGQDSVEETANEELDTSKEYTSKTGKKHTKWTTAEKLALKRIFSKQLETKHNATATQIRRARQDPALKTRSEAQLRVKINNIIKGKERFCV